MTEENKIGPSTEELSVGDGPIEIKEPRMTPEKIEEAEKKPEAAQEADKKEEQVRAENSDAFDLCMQLRKELLAPAGIRVESYVEGNGKDSKWLYFTVFEYRLDGMRSRAQATKAGIELLAKLKKAGLAV